MSKWNRQGCIANNALQINLQTEKPKKVRTLMVKTRYKLWHVYDYTITYWPVLGQNVAILSVNTDFSLRNGIDHFTDDTLNMC